MRNTPTTALQRGVVLLTALVIVKVTIAAIWGYGDYFPPDFRSEFLRGREAYFFGSYQATFYAHIAAGPISLVLGMLLINQRFRLRFPTWHRYLGRVQGVNVLVVVAPSGLWMARYASTGAIAGVAFALLAISTASCVLLGWRSAIKRRFADHRRWMWRCFLLLCSAVVIRVLGGMGTVMGIEAPWFNPAASWSSWLVPLAVFELYGLRKRRIGRSRVKPVSTSDSADLTAATATATVQSSFAEMEIKSRRWAADVSAERKCTLPSTKAACSPNE